MKKESMNDLRGHLFQTIEDLKNGKIDIEKSKAIADLGQVIVNSARLEVDAMKIISNADNTQLMKDAIKHSTVLCLNEPVEPTPTMTPPVKIAPASPLPDAARRVDQAPEKKRLGRPKKVQPVESADVDPDDQVNMELYNKAFKEKGFNAVLGY